jgi:hypothetical protein
MVKLSTVILISVAIFSATSAFAACDYPPEISVPDGSQATEDEMLAAQKAVKAYMAEMEAYLKCLDDESATLGDAETDEQRAMHVQRHNAAIDAMENVANNFNDQIRAYKAMHN